MPNTPNKNLPYPSPSDPADVPADMGELALAIDALPAAAAWVTGDTKVSAQAATHADPAGGTWYLADGSAIPGGNPGLVALLGATFPDGRGRLLALKGTHADVNGIGKVESAALAVGSRRIKHGHSHALGTQWGNPVGGSPPTIQTGGNNIQGTIPAAGTVGVAGAGVDEPAFVVAGNLFYHS